MLLIVYIERWAVSSLLCFKPSQARAAIEERNTALQETVSRLKEDLHASDSRKSSLEQEMRHLQAELADTQRRLTVAEATNDVTDRVG